MYKALIERLVRTCCDQPREGLTESEIRLLLADHIKKILPQIHPKDFVEWIRDDSQYSFYFYDMQESGACYKPAEMAALILETIALEALGSAE